MNTHTTLALSERKSRLHAAVTRDDLETLLQILTQFGKPRLSHMGQGWVCIVNMWVTAAGVEFEVKSEFSMETPLAAAKQCAQRLEQALRDIGGEK